MLVHQIWIGSPVPARVSRALDSVRSAASAAGWQHRLWRWQDIASAFGDAPAISRLSSELAAAPDDVRLRVIAADYARLLILARFGGLFLDADFDAVGAFPELPAGGADVLGIEDYHFGDRPQEDTLHMANGALWVTTDRSRTAMQLASRAAADRLQHVSRASVPFLPDYLGPAWLRRDLLPLWRSSGFTAALLPATLIGKETDPAPLIHHALASWRFPSRVLPQKEPKLSIVHDLTPNGTHIVPLPSDAPKAPNSLIRNSKFDVKVRNSLGSLGAASIGTVS